MRLYAAVERNTNHGSSNPNLSRERVGIFQEPSSEGCTLNHNELLDWKIRARNKFSQLDVGLIPRKSVDSTKRELRSHREIRQVQEIPTGDVSGIPKLDPMWYPQSS